MQRREGNQGFKGCDVRSSFSSPLFSGHGLFFRWLVAFFTYLYSLSPSGFLHVPAAHVGKLLLRSICCFIHRKDRRGRSGFFIYFLLNRIFSGFSFDPTKYTNLSLAEKRELVFRLSKWSRGPKTLQSWRRKDLLEILCAELGKERKYTGVTKDKLIVNLLKIVFEKRTGTHTGAIDLRPSNHHHQQQQLPCSNPPPSSKRQRKMENPSRLPIVGSNSNFIVASAADGEVFSNRNYCRNAACKDILDPEDSFCRRCTCCICYTYDDNKDPSLWLVCTSDHPSEGSSSSSCGVSCHLECAFQHEKSGIAGKHGDRLDVSFRCVSCGKINDLLRCLRKQLLIAKEARRVDVLCHRIFLSHRLLTGTDKYQNINHIVDGMMNKLEAEVGPLNGLPTGMVRGIVNRLGSGTQVQKLCSLAIDLIDSIISHASKLSIEVASPKTNSSADESNSNAAACGDLNKLPEDNRSENEGTPGNSVSALDEEHTANTTRNARVDTVLPATPSKLEACKDGGVTKNARVKPVAKPVKQVVETGGASLKKTTGGEQVFVDSSVLEGDYEYLVKVIRWLESTGHIDNNFRVKFLTWFSLRATQSERKVVSVFVDTLIEDPPSLAGQLVDTFAEGINTKKSHNVPGFCTKLWH